MTTIDRYIARQYLFNVVALLVLLCSFVVTVDVTLNLDRFMDRAEAIEKESAKQARAVVTTAPSPAGSNGAAAKPCAPSRSASPRRFARAC